MIFICEICSKPLGTVNLEELSTPFTAGMFKSLDASRGIPAPFPDILTDWLLFSCKQCKRRPFKTHNSITVINDKGFSQQINVDKFKIEQKTREQNQADVLSVESEEDKKFVCKCGKSYQHESSLSRHKKDCNG